MSIPDCDWGASGHKRAIWGVRCAGGILRMSYEWNNFGSGADQVRGGLWGGGWRVVVVGGFGGTFPE